MKFKVRLTEKAEHDLDCALAWFYEQGASAAAAKWLAQVLRAIDTLETMPNRCGLISESADLGLEIRELRVGKRNGAYRILFEVREQFVFVLRVWHASRDHVTRTDFSPPTDKSQT